MAGALRELIDHNAIVALCIRYATALDSRDWALLRTCFEPDVVAEYAGIGEILGYDALEQVCQRALMPLDASQHFLGNHVVVLDGDEADATTYLQAQHVRSGIPGGDTFLLAGKYTDRVVRRDGGWRFKTRKLEVMWTQGNRAVMAP
jgi:hypothetical protein